MPLTAYDLPGSALREYRQSAAAAAGGTLQFAQVAVGARAASPQFAEQFDLEIG